MLTQFASVPFGMVEIIEQLTIAILCKGPSQKGLEPTTGGLTVGEQIWRSLQCFDEFKQAGGDHDLGRTWAFSRSKRCVSGYLSLRMSSVTTSA